jgi:hypothetical protein
MQIECKLQRKGGTHVDMPGASYHFAPQEDGRHVAEVSIEAHIERFLSISEAYGLVRTPGAEVAEAAFAAPAPVPAPQAAPIVSGPLKHAEGFQANYLIGGRQYVLGEFVARAFADSGVTEIEWNELPDETRAIKIEMVMDAVQDGELVLAAPVAAPATPPATPPVEAPVDPERAALVTAYMTKFGKSPRNMTNDTIKAKLAE